MESSKLARRGFVLQGSLGLSAALGGTLFHGLRASAMPQDPPVRNPRSTDGDRRFEPDWKERLTVTVGNSREGSLSASGADFVGENDRVVQAALDYIKRFGGGTVKLLAGTFVFRNSVFLPSGVRLVGSGLDTILTKIASETLAIESDSDWYDREITLGQSGSFQVGDGVVLRAKNPDNGGPIVIKRTLVARDGNRFKLDRGLRENLWIEGKPTCSSLFPILTSENTEDVWIEDLAIDGNKANNQNLDGNYGGCIFLQDCNRYTIRNVTARNYNGDGISFQICHDVLVESCHSHDNQDLGLHPGSGSQRPVMRSNRLERNDQGLFWCWGVKFGLAEDNTMVANRSYGSSIGHNDTDNVMRRNRIVDSGKIGVLFRDDARGIDFWANRNVLEENHILNSGGQDGVAIEVQGKTRELVFRKNELHETRGAQGRVGIRLGKDSGKVEMDSNRIEGFSKDLEDLRGR
jgi:hypothetical protein